MLTADMAGRIPRRTVPRAVCARGTGLGAAIAATQVKESSRAARLGARGRGGGGRGGAVVAGVGSRQPHPKLLFLLPYCRLQALGSPRAPPAVLGCTVTHTMAGGGGQWCLSRSPRIPPHWDSTWASAASWVDTGTLEGLFLTEVISHQAPKGLSLTFLWLLIHY